MRGMRRMLLLAMSSLAVVSASVVAGQAELGRVSWEQPQEVRDLRVGERYTGGTRVRSPFMGVSFVVPKHWRASLPAGSVVFLDSAVTAGLGTVHLLTDVTRETMRAQLSEPQAIEAGFVLHPVGSLHEAGQTITGRYAAGDDVGVTIAVLGPSRNAVIYQFVGRETEQNVYRRLAEELAGSTEFISAQDGPALRTWYERLTGMMLTPQLDSRVAQSVGSTALHLCSDGRFIWTIRLQSVPGRPADGEEGGAYHETGTWRIEAQGIRAGLVLTKSTGGIDQHEVLRESDQFLFDGQAVSVTVSNSCL